MQLELTNDIEGEGQQQGRTAVDNSSNTGSGGNNPSLQRSGESHAYKSCLGLLFNKCFDFANFSFIVSTYAAAAAHFLPS